MRLQRCNLVSELRGQQIQEKGSIEGLIQEYIKSVCKLTKTNIHKPMGKSAEQVNRHEEGYGQLTQEKELDVTSSQGKTHDNDE